MPQPSGPACTARRACRCACCHRPRSPRSRSITTAFLPASRSPLPPASTPPRPPPGASPPPAPIPIPEAPLPERAWCPRAGAGGLHTLCDACRVLEAEGVEAVSCAARCCDMCSIRRGGRDMSQGVHACAHAHAFALTYARARAPPASCSGTCTHTHLRVSTSTRVCTHTRIRTCTRTRTRTRTL